MAEFLIRKTNHWTREEAKKETPSLTAQQAIDVLKTHQIGDVVEIYEDGRCKEAPAEGSIYWIVKVKDIKKSDYEYLTHPLTHADGDKTVMDKRRRYRLLTESLPQEIISTLEKERWVTITSDDFAKYLSDAGKATEE